MIDALREPAHLQQYEALLAQSFPVPPGGSFYDDFPVWDPRRAVQPILHAGVLIDGRVVAGASARVATLRTSAGPVAVAIIGAVCCDSEYRGQGFASKLVEVLNEWSDNQQVAAQLLWSSELSMYARLGFREAGAQVRYAIEGGAAGIAGIRLGWHPGLWTLVREKRARGLELREIDRTWFEAHRNTQWVWLPDAQTGAPCAFIAVGRGIDLPGMVHEWSGTPAQVRQLLGAVAQAAIAEKKELLLLGSPADGAALGGLREVLREPLCLMRGGENLGADFWIWGLDAG